MAMMTNFSPSVTTEPSEEMMHGNPGYDLVSGKFLKFELHFSIPYKIVEIPTYM